MPFRDPASGLPAGVNIQHGAGSPAGSVTPTATGSLYVDTTNGALYLAVGATSANWVIVAGVGGASGTSTTVGVTTEALNGKLGTVLTSPSLGFVLIGDKDGLAPAGSGNGILWDAGTGDHLQSLSITWGASGLLSFVGSDSSLAWRTRVGSNPIGLYQADQIANLAIPVNQAFGWTTQGEFCFYDGSSWTILALSAVVFRALTTPPVSGTIYHNTTGHPLQASLRAVLATNPVLASDVKVEISPDNFGSAQVWADPAYAAGAVAVGADAEYISFPIPTGWFYKVTATNSVLGALVAIG